MHAEQQWELPLSSGDPRNELDSESFAFELLFGQGQEHPYPRLIGADAWFDRDEAQHYEPNEQSVRTADLEILTLLILNKEGMLEDWGRCQKNAMSNHNLQLPGE